MAGIESDEASPAGRTKRVSTNEQEFQQYAKATYWLFIHLLRSVSDIFSMA